ncbi:MAG TPA: hypothetical protein ENJ50_02950, partial [Planctomycetaceae bacterium]|nr:hypothetical protein [Planctomycetaceae bacterium]
MHKKEESLIGVLTVVVASVVLPGIGRAEVNLIRNGGFDARAAGEWAAPRNVVVQRVEEGDRTGGAVLKVSWSDVTAFRDWAKTGGLLRSTDRILEQPLRRDTRYRLSCRIKVERFDVAAEARAWYAGLPEGQFDPPTVTVGCQGGYWNSGMPWMAYDMSKLGTWQELQCEFVTPFNTAGGLVLTLDAYPRYQTPMRSSGVLYLDDVRLQVCAPRVGFTRSRKVKRIDGELSDWWQTNPVVITSDQVSRGAEAPNRDACGLLYTMWDDSHLYVAAKVIDDQISSEDGVAVLLDDHRYSVTLGAKSVGCQAAVRRVAALGSTTNMYRIVSQYGEDIRGRDGYVVELAIPRPASPVGREPNAESPPPRVVFEILDVDRGGESRRLRYPYTRAAGEQQQSAEVRWGSEEGELLGGE